MSVGLNLFLVMALQCGTRTLYFSITCQELRAAEVFCVCVLLKKCLIITQIIDTPMLLFVLSSQAIDCHQLL